VVVIQDPIPNTPYAPPTRHFRFDDDGIHDPALALELPVEEMVAIARRYGAAGIALFGSVLRPKDFRSDSDVDVLVSFPADLRYTLFDFVRLKRELSDLVGRDVDLVDREGLKRFVRPEVLKTMQVLYGAA